MQTNILWGFEIYLNFIKIITETLTRTIVIIYSTFRKKKINQNKNEKFEDSVW